MGKPLEAALSIGDAVGVLAHAPPRLRLPSNLELVVKRTVESLEGRRRAQRRAILLPPRHPRRVCVRGHVCAVPKVQRPVTADCPVEAMQQAQQRARHHDRVEIDLEIETLSRQCLEHRLEDGRTLGPVVMVT